MFAALPALTALPLAGRIALSLSLNCASALGASRACSGHNSPTFSQSNLASPCEVLLELMQQSLLPSQQLGVPPAQGPQTV